MGFTFTPEDIRSLLVFCCFANARAHARVLLTQRSAIGVLSTRTFSACARALSLSLSFSLSFFLSVPPSAFFIFPLLRRLACLCCSLCLLVYVSV